MAKTHDVIIIGAGQAGLSASHYLVQKGIEHLVLEGAPAPGSAWRGHWDSFTLNTPNFMLNLPGAAYQGMQPESFLNRDQVCSYLETYAAGKPVLYNTTVLAVEPRAGGGFHLLTTQGEYFSKQVVVATGGCQNPKIPAYSRELPASILQIHSGRYKNPSSLPDGAVLVVGSGQSGCQIAEELNQAGRKVYLSVSRAGRIPRRYRGRDSLRWMMGVGFFSMTPDKLPSPSARYAPNPQISGNNGGHDINLHIFARNGIALLGRVQGFTSGTLHLAEDLNQNLAYGDEFEANMLNKFDAWIQANGIDAPPEDRLPRRDGFVTSQPGTLDLEASGIRTVIWAGGYLNDYSLLHLPVLDSAGQPVHVRGITSVPGLYFLGLLWMHRRSSSLLWGVGEDAEYLANHIAAGLNLASPPDSKTQLSLQH